MFELKPLHKKNLPAALEKAKHYRLINEPTGAESICGDIIEIEPDHQEALVTLLLALTDQFEEGRDIKQPREILDRLADDYNKAYYEGIIYERWAKAVLKQGYPRCQHEAYEWFRRAMEVYEKAAEISPPEVDDAILRWNTCARILNRDPHLGPEPEEPFVPELLE